VVAAVVPQRSPSPALSCVKLTAGKNGNVGELTLAGTDAETSVQLTIHQVDVSQTGVAIVPAHKLQQIVGGQAGTTYRLRCQVDLPDGRRYVLATVLPVRTA
jgi:DNA polymerase III sliding clamp (beta) subunit (PCNA family)